MAFDARGLIWADGTGLPARATGELLLERMRGVEEGTTEDDDGTEGAGRAAATPVAPAPEAPSLRAGIASTPVAAEIAARHGWRARSARKVRHGPRAPHPPGHGGTRHAAAALTIVPDGEDREFIAPIPLSALRPAPPLDSLLAGVGLATCGDLAALSPEAVEVRFGPEGVRLRRLARAEDRRRIFGAMPGEWLHASLDFIDYVVTDPARLIFTANALLAGICEKLTTRGEHARRMSLSLPLGDRSVWMRTLRPARPTANRDTWLRIARSLLERLSVPDAVTGVHLEVETTEPAAVRQGDLFDRGFATAGAVEAAIARLLEEQGTAVVLPENNGHLLPERRTRWREREPTEVAEASAPVDHERTDEAGARLTLQLLPEPRPVRVELAGKRGRSVPVRYRDRDGWRKLVRAAGPDRLSGGQWEEAYAREYFRCVTAEGILVWLFRDARRQNWYLHGWWD